MQKLSNQPLRTYRQILPHILFGGIAMQTCFCSVFLCGIPVSVLGMLGAAALLTAADLPFSCYHVIAVLPLLCGCLLSGYRAGKAARRNGWQNGFAAALLLTAIWYAAACFFCRRSFLPVLLILSLPCGMLGGVLGVNTKLPLPKRRHHGAVRIPRGILLGCKAAAGRRRARRNQTASGRDDAKNC